MTASPPDADTPIPRARILPQTRRIIVGLGLGAIVAVVILPELALGGALLLATILAPTDAALGSEVVSNPRVPVRIRQTLNVESGLNDGLALPGVLILASIVGAQGDSGHAPETWARFVALQLVLGLGIGATVGGLGGLLIERGSAAERITAAFQRLSALGLAVVAFASAEITGGNGFVASFVAGVSMGNVARGVCRRLYDFGEAEGLLLMLLVFLIFGAAMLPSALESATIGAFGYALASLTLVRMSAIALSLWGAGLRPASVAFLGWFGPRGLASILFLLVVIESREWTHSVLLETVVVLTVAASTLLHGVSAYPFARLYGRRCQRLRERAPVEHAKVSEMPLRIGPQGGTA